jgi:hypothetical protein
MTPVKVRYDNMGAFGCRVWIQLADGSWRLVPKRCSDGDFAWPTRRAAEIGVKKYARRYRAELRLAGA